jgi:hypothetical protein
MTYMPPKGIDERADQIALISRLAHERVGRLEQNGLGVLGGDLLVMGRPEGAGCYCAANNIIRKYMDKLADNYPYTVMDNEAGLEHLNRRITSRVDILFDVLGPSNKSFEHVKRAHRIAREVGIAFDRFYVVGGCLFPEELEGIDAMLSVPRHLFVEEAMAAQAYADSPLPIGEKQTISQPYIVALMTEALKLERWGKVLEIGTGSGYQTAILAELAAKVFSIERIRSLTIRARKLIYELGYLSSIPLQKPNGQEGQQPCKEGRIPLLFDLQKGLPALFLQFVTILCTS